MNPKEQNDLRELAYHLGLLVIQDYSTSMEPDPTLAAYVNRQVAGSRRRSEVRALYLNPVDLDESLYNSRVLRNLEDLLVFSQLPDSRLTSPRAREFLDVFTAGDLATQRLNPARETLDALLALFSHEGALEDRSDAKGAINLLIILLVKLGVADQELFEGLLDVPRYYSNQYKSWALDYDLGQASAPGHAPAPNGLIDQWLAALTLTNRDFPALVAHLADHPIVGYDALPGPTPYLLVDGSAKAIRGQHDLEHHVLGLMLMAGRA